MRLCPGSHRTDLQQQDCLHMRIILVAEKLILDVKLVSIEELGPITLFTGFPGRSQTMHRRFDRGRIGFHHYRNKLPGAGKFRLGIPRRP